MRILYVCHRLPYPPNRGGKIRPFYMIKHLSENHEVVVASLARSREEADEGKGLSEFASKVIEERVTSAGAWTRMIARLPTPTPSSMGYFYSPRLARRIREELRSRKFDLIFVHCSSVAQYVEDVKGIPKILDFGDMDSQKWLMYVGMKRFPLSMGYWLEGKKMERAEKALAAKFDLCTATTPAERQTLDDFRTGTPSDWFPNGVNFEYFAPNGKEAEEDLLSFVGRMDYYPNEQCMLEFCDRTLPLIRERRPGVKLVIVGANPPSSVLDLGKLPGVTVTGSVPDIRPHVQRSSVSIAPLEIARGTQNKILESMAMGLPCVVSNQAARGIDAVPDEHFLAASGPREFADAVVRLLEDRELRERFATAGRERMISNHNWEHSMMRLDEIIGRGLEFAGSRPKAPIV